MARLLPIILSIVVMSGAATAWDATAAGPWDGDYRGQGKFDIDRRCIPRKFEAAGVIENNVLIVSVRSKGKVVGKLKFKVTDTGRIYRTFLCATGDTAAYAEGRVGPDGIRLRTLPMMNTRGRGNVGTGGTITMSRVPGPQAAQRQPAARPGAGQAAADLARFGLDPGHFRAIVIGNNDYQNVPKLRLAVSDAVAVSETLERLYGFEVELLLDISRYDILNSLSKARADLTERDNLLIYYAGHGVVDEATGRCYWLPVDAEPDSVANWIANTTLSDMIKAIPAKHVMVVADSCFSGTLLRAATITPKTGGDRAAFLNRMAARRSRTALVSGGLEPVSDAGGGKPSVFAKAILDALHENDAVLDGQGLFAAVRRQLITNADQTPKYSDLRGAGRDGGDFLFVRQ